MRVNVSSFLHLVSALLITLPGWSSEGASGNSNVSGTARQVKAGIASVDAISGQMEITLPLGPRLPGRIPLGISWHHASGQRTNGSTDSNKTESTFRANSWPTWDAVAPLNWVQAADGHWSKDEKPQGRIRLTLGHRQLTFYPAGVTADTVRPWLTERGVAGSGTGVHTIDRVMVTADGSTFLVQSRWSENLPELVWKHGYNELGEWITWQEPTTPLKNYQSCRLVVISGDLAIWTATSPLAQSPEPQVTEYRNRWGDWATATQSGWPLSQVALVSSLGHTITLDCTGSNWTITNSMGFANWTLTGSVAGFPTEGATLAPELRGTRHQLETVSDGVRQQTLQLSWDAQGHIQSTNQSSGLVHTFDWSGSTADPAPEAFAVAEDSALGLHEGDWKGYEPIHVTGSLYRLGAGRSAVASITVSGGAGEPGQVTSFTRTIPQPLGYDNTARTITWANTSYRTEIRVAVSGKPTRFTRLQHAEPLGYYGAPPMTGYAGQTEAIQRQMLLFALSTVVSEERGTQEGGAETIWERVVSDGWSLKAMTNTIGSLAGLVSLDPVATRVTRSRPNQDGPTVTQELMDWNGRSYRQTHTATSAPGSAPASPDPGAAGFRGISFPDNATVSGGIERTHQTTRAWNASLPGEQISDSSTSLAGSSYSGLRESAADSLGTKHYDYDSQGRLYQETGTTGSFTASTTFGHGTGPEVTETTRSLPGAALSGLVGEVFTWDGPFRRSVRQKPDPRSTDEGRNGLGQMTSQTSLEGITTSFTYDGLGRPYTSTRPVIGAAAGLATETTYSANGRTITVTATGTDGITSVTKTTRDAFGRTVQTETNVGAPGVKVVASGYDGFGQKEWESLPAATASGPRVQYTYEADGFLRTVTHPRGGTTTYTRPAWGALGGISGFVSTVTTTRGTTTLVKDLLGQTRCIKDPLGQSTILSYDKFGRLSKLERGAQSRSYTYNDVGWLLSQTQPEEGTTIYSDHTILGLARTTTRDPVTVTTVLDNNGRVDTLDASGLGSSVARKFFYNGNNAHPSKLTETQDQGSITETYEYDDLARLKLKTIFDGSQTFRVSRKLDSFGKVSELNYPEGGGKGARKVVPRYDGGQRLEFLDFEGSNLATMAYDVGGADQDKLTYVNEATTTWSRDGNQDLSRVTHHADGADVENLLVEWTPDGLMKTRGTDTFEYDDLSRLHVANVSGLNGERIQQIFGYDSFGNRNSVSSVAQAGLLPKEAATFALAFGADNRLPAATAAGALTGASYDALGRLQEVYAVPGDAATRTSWVHDALGRVVRQGGADAAWQERYLLDGAGLRFRRTKLDGTVVYTVYGFQREPLSTFEVAAPNGSKALKIFHSVANAGALSRSLGTFQAGDVATVSLRFKAAAGVSAAAFLTDGKPPATGDHKAFASAEGNGGWQQLTFSLPLNAGENLTLSLYGDAFTATSTAATAATYVIYDDVKVTSVLRGTVLNETFEGGLDGLMWLGCGQVNEWVDLAAPGPLAWKSDAVYGWGQLIFEKRGTAKIFQQGDHLGSPSILTDGTGKVVGRQKSLPFGERLAGTGQTSLRRFTNHEDGPQYPVQMQARMYLPSYGRFAEVDPVYDHSSDGLNLYSYVSNNPVTQSDPDGMREMGGTGRGPQFQTADWDWDPAADPIEEWASLGGGSDNAEKKSESGGNSTEEHTAAESVSQGEASQTGQPSAWQRFKSWVGEFLPSWMNLDPINPTAQQQTRGVTDGGIESDRSATAVARANGAGVQDAGAAGVAGSRVALDVTLVAGTFGAGSGVTAIASNSAREIRLANGFYEASGTPFKFSKYYYEKLWSTGRGAPFLQAEAVLNSATKVTPDRMQGFFRYTTKTMEMVYNPTTREVWHLQPIR